MLFVASYADKEDEALMPERIPGKNCCADCNNPKARHKGDEVKEELEESKIVTPEQEASFHSKLFGTRLVALNAKLMSNFIKK